MRLTLLAVMAMVGGATPLAAQPADPGITDADQDESGDLPRHGRLSWSASDGSWVQSAILEFTAIAVLGASRLTGYPEVGRLVGGEPEALRLHIGGVGELGSERRVGYAVRVDLSESLRIRADEARQRPVVAIDRLLDSAYGLLRLTGTTRVLIGRQPVAVSRFQQVPSSLQNGGAPPFVVDRVFPLRRWGVRGKLTAGRFDISAGGWLEGDDIEARTVVGDPSFGGVALASVDGTWTIRGERERHWLPRQVDIGESELEESRFGWADPRLAVHAGALARFGDSTRIDVTLAADAGQGRFGGVAEVIASIGSSQHLSVAAELDALIHRRASIFVRGELDGERDLYATGAGISYFATVNRRNRLAFYAWLRRDPDSPFERDGVVIELQASL